MIKKQNNLIAERPAVPAPPSPRHSSSVSPDDEQLQVSSTMERSNPFNDTAFSNFNTEHRVHIQSLAMTRSKLSQTRQSDDQQNSGFHFKSQLGAGFESCSSIHYTISKDHTKDDNVLKTTMLAALRHRSSSHREEFLSYRNLDTGRRKGDQMFVGRLPFSPMVPNSEKTFKKWNHD